MDENKNLQPELSPEDQLDQLLARFLAEPDLEVPGAESIPEEPLAAELEVAEPAAEPEMPAAQTQEPAPVLESPVTVVEVPASEDTESVPEIEAPVPVIAEPVAESEVPAPETEVPTPEAAHMPDEVPPAPAEEPRIEAFDDAWIGELLDVPMVTEEIGADESAVAAAGLVHPEDQEFVDILQEVRDEQTPVEVPEEDGQIPPILSPDTVPAAEPTQPAEIPEKKEPEEMAKNTPTEEIPETLPQEAEPRPLWKTRPRKKGTYGFFSLPHLAATVIWLAIIVFIGVSLGNILWEYAADMLAFGREDSTVTITIAETDDLDTICDKLHSTGLIKYPSLFKLYANLADAMEDINPGTYKLNTQFDYNALVDAMSSLSTRVSIKVTIPEGYNCAQIFQLLEDKGVCTVSALQKASTNVNAEDYWFLEGVSNEGKYWLEGYLFPDTYTFYLNHSAEGVLDKLLDNFDRRLTESMRAKLPVLNETLSEMMRKNGLSEEYIAAHQMTLREVVIVASMIEKEAAHTTEGYTVASVIYNRLTNPNAYPCLQIDATLVYVTGHSVLTSEDLALDDPYNTYKYPGLVPGPISNPSQASLSAALDPDNTSYYYYALNPATGEHKFSETLAEHEQFLESLKKSED